MKGGVGQEQYVHHHLVYDLDDAVLVAFPVQPHPVQEHFLHQSNYPQTSKAMLRIRILKKAPLFAKPYRGNNLPDFFPPK